MHLMFTKYNFIQDIAIERRECTPKILYNILADNIHVYTELSHCYICFFFMGTLISEYTVFPGLEESAYIQKL